MRTLLLCLVVLGLHSLGAEEKLNDSTGNSADATPASTIKKADGLEVSATALPPELEAIRHSIDKGEQVMHDIFNKRMEVLRSAFIAEMEDAAANADASLNVEAAKFLRRRGAELKPDTPMILAYLPNEPAEWLALVKSGRQKLEAWRIQYEEQAAKLSAIFRQQLKQAALTYVEKKQPADAMRAAQMARGLQSWLSLRGRIWASGVEKTAIFGGGGGSRFLHVVKEGGVLVGFHFTEKSYAGHNIIGSLTPVYLTSQGRITGPTFGSPKGDVKEVIAREGFSVAGIISTSGERLDGFRVIFMRLKENEAGLDPKSRYVSDNLGGKGGHLDVPCGDDGRLVVGVCGRCGGDVDAAGLILLEKTR